MSDDLGNSVKEGVAIGGTIGAAGAAAIGLAVGAAVPPPFSAVCAPLGAALGALIALFVGLGKRHEYTPEELAQFRQQAEAARQKSAQLVDASSKTAAGLGNAAEELIAIYPMWVAQAALSAGLSYQRITDTIDADFDNWISTSEQGRVLLKVGSDHPEYEPLVDGFISSVKQMTKEIVSQVTTPGQKPVDFGDSPQGKSMMKMRDFFHALSQMPGNLDSDPFAYLRPPMAQYMGPALASVGINISDPSVLELMRGNYNLGVASPRKVIGGIPISRASLAKRSGGRVAMDKRAFSPKIAPYGVGSFAMFPASAPGPSWLGNSDAGLPLSGPWQHGLDADNFAKPPSKITAANVAKVGIPAAVVIALLFFL